MKEQTIKTIINTYLKKWIDSGLNKIPQEIEPEMSDPNQDKKEEWRTWFPIKSKVTDSEINELESRIGYKLPNDFIIFLKQQHFYELYISEAAFCSHPVNSWRAKMTGLIFDSYPRIFLIEKGYIPFAQWSDWGLLCFDTNKNKGDNDYPVVLWDHEAADKVQHLYNNFYELLLTLDENGRTNNL